MTTPTTEHEDITGPDVAAYVGDRGDDDFTRACAREAVELVTQYLGSRVEAVPRSVVRRAQLEVAGELFHRRKAPSGISQFATPDGSPVRVARDPMLGAYPLLDRFLGGGFA